MAARARLGGREGRAEEVVLVDVYRGSEEASSARPPGVEFKIVVVILVSVAIVDEGRVIRAD